jgi:tetratricopeptide (TPR) repeat protein
MTYLDTWRTNLKAHLAEFAVLAKEDRNINLIYGITAAAVLWGVRDAPFDDTQKSALKEACGDEKHLLHLVRAVGDWDAMTQLEAARSLSKRQRDSDELRDALTALMGTFVEILLAEKMLQTQNITIEGDVHGANVNIGGYQVFTGETIIQYIRPVTSTCPTAPKPPDHFTGREAELRELRERLTGDEVVAITAVQAMGGMGKTTLAQALCHQPDKPFDAVLWTSLGENPQTTSILMEWARYAVDDYALKPDAKPEEIAAWVRGQLTQLMHKQNGCGERWLVVFDDVWKNQASYDAIALLQTALPAGIRTLITTRQADAASYLRAASVELYELSSEDALKLLQRLEDNHHLTNDHLKRAVDIIKGHPLTLEIAIASLNDAEDADDIRAILDEYERGIRDGSPFDAPNLHVETPRSLNVVFERSYNALTIEDQARFRALGVLAPDTIWERSLVGALWEIDDEKDLMKAHKTLRLAAFIKQDKLEEHEYGKIYYKQHPLLRSYARALLNMNNEMHAIFNRYANHLIFLLESLRPPTLFVQKEFEWKNVDAGIPQVVHLGNELLRLTENGSKEHFLIHALAFGLAVPHLKRTHRHIALLDWLNMCLNGTRTLQASDRPYVHLGSFVLFEGYRHLEGLFLHSVGDEFGGNLRDYPKAIEYNQEALVIFQEYNDQQFQGMTINALAHWQFEMEPHSPEKVEELLSQAEEAADIFGRFGDQSNKLNMQGLLFTERKQPEQALPLFEQALRIAQGRDNKPAIATITNNIGVAWDVAGDKEKALDYYLQAKTLYESIRDNSGIAQTLYNAGNMYRQLEDFLNAIQFFEESIALYDELENTHQVIAPILPLLVDAYLSIDDLQKAIETLERCVQIEIELQHQDLENHRELLTHLRLVRDTRLSPEQAYNIAENTLGALISQESQEEWHAELMELCTHARARKDLSEIQYFEALLQIMDGQIPAFPPDNPYVHIIKLVLDVIEHQRDNNGVNPIEEQTAETMQQLAHIYQQGGEEAVHAILKGQMPDGMIEEITAQLSGISASQATQNTLPADTVQTLAGNTIAVMTEAPEERDKWRENLQGIRNDFDANGDEWIIEVAFVGALLAILDGDKPTLPEDNPYKPYLLQLLERISNMTSNTLPQDLLETLITNTIAVKTQDGDQMELWREYLTHLHNIAVQKNEKNDLDFFKSLLSILDDKPASLPDDNPYQSNLQKVLDSITKYDPSVSILKPAWEFTQDLLTKLVNNTIAVKTQYSDQIEKWRQELKVIQNTTTELKAKHELAFVNALLNVLDV